MANARGLGYRPDFPSDKDHMFAAHRAATTPIPHSASVDDARVFAKNQGSLSACVGCAWAQALRLSYLKQGVVCPDLSALYVYRLARNIDGTAGDEGSQLRSGAQAVMRLGCAPESAWPLVESRVNDQLPFSAQYAGFDRNGQRHYYRITKGDTNGVKRAIVAGFAVTGGWSVDEAFVENDGRDIIDAIRGAIVGGHAMCISGFDGDTFSIIGSWGDDYGHAGRIKITKAFIAQGTDLWACSVGE